MRTADLAVVGAGPAGLAAALEAADAGAKVTVIDEQAASGGQIFRQPPGSFTVAAGVKKEGQRLRERAAAHPHIRFCLGTTVWGILEDRTLALSSPAGHDRLKAGRILLAPGAYDLPVAFPGWTLPGVMGAGGVQAFLKGQQLLPGRRFLLAGAHPLLLVIGAQLVEAGAEVEAVLFAQKPQPGAMLRHLPALWGHWDRLGEAVRAWRTLRRANVPVRFGEMITGAEGTDGLVAAKVAHVDERWHVRPGTEYQVPVDTIALGYGFLPSTELARQAGAAVRWAPEEGGWVCVCSDEMESSVPGLFVAGEITGVGGAGVALEEGRLAGIAIAEQLGLISPADAAERKRAVRRSLERERRFAGVLHQVFAPREGISRLMTDETVVCRCEGLTAGHLRQSIRENPHLTHVNALKLFTRCGMGLCQGRFCGVNAARLVAEVTGRTEEAAGQFTARVPVKPIPLAELVRCD